MITYGYAKDYKYLGDGTLSIQVRIPSVHGAYLLSDYQGKRVHNYVEDENLPYYPSLLLPSPPGDGEVVVLESLNSSSSSWLVIGMTGGAYGAGARI